MEKSKSFKFLFLVLPFYFLVFTFMGCATYKFTHGKEPYHKGYVVSRDDYTILEYTAGKDNSVPKLDLARERFKRRRKIVEHYYKRMGFLENHFKMVAVDPVIFFIKMVGGVFRLPIVAVSDYRYRNNPAYRDRIRKIEAEKDLAEEARIQRLKDQLNSYIQQDLARENP